MGILGGKGKTSFQKRMGEKLWFSDSIYTRALNLAVRMYFLVKNIGGILTSFFKVK